MTAIRLGLKILPFIMAWSISAIAHSQSLTQPATTQADAIDPILWERLKEIDRRAGRIKDLSATFEQQKFTALLKKPLVSSGRVRVAGSTMRWDTAKPDPTIMVIDEREMRLYYPRQKTVEVYPINQKMARLAASPLPRLDVLRKHFKVEEIPAREMNQLAEGPKFLALLLTPIDSALREHIDQVRVLLDADSAYILRAEMIDPDGDRTVISFADIQLNLDIKPDDLKLMVPEGAAITRPLEGLGE